jgi:transcriptional regulator with XRE-family HTH domain
MVPSFGARLRAERERKQIALRTIADETKIKASLFEGLEHDDLSFWPGGLFRRAYVRAYARAVGLDPERIVSEFLEKYPEPEEPVPEDPVTPRSLLTSPIATVSALLQRGARNEPTKLDIRIGGGVTVPHEVADDAPDVALVHPEPGFLAVSDTADVALVHPEPGFLAVSDTADETPAPSEPAFLAVPDTADETPAPPEPSLLAVSDLCTRMARLADRRGLPPLLGDATGILDAVGLIVWSWDSGAAILRASLANGYSDATVAQLPAVATDADNAVAAAFRSRAACVVPGGPGLTGAVAVPLMAPGGCVGVLAIEVQNGSEQLESVRACVAILAAQLAGLVGPVALAEAVA